MKTMLNSVFFILMLIFVISPVLPYDVTHCADSRPPLQFSKNRDVQQVKPKRPVKIKLHRNTKGEYMWDITGDNADEVAKADARLRNLLKTE